MTFELFSDGGEAGALALAPGAWILPAWAESGAESLLAAVATVAACAPFRHMRTPGGRAMAVAMTNCGPLGWISDEAGYRYGATDPLTARPWPAMPGVLSALAEGAARAAGYPGFVPDACLINRYLPGVGLSRHQDRDERDLAAPIVSVSLGLPAIFLFGGLRRADSCRRYRLGHGDVVVWGGPSRLCFHGVAPLAPGSHPLLGPERINLTFRRAG